MWKIVLGRCTVRVRFSFMLLSALLFLLRDPVLIRGFCAGSALHELGHVLAAYLTGGRISSVELRGTGVLMTVRRDRLPSLGQELFVLLSGPAVNLLMAAELYLRGAVGSALLIQLWQGLSNLLPFPGLDGGAALELLIMGRPDERALLRLIWAVRAAAAAGIVLAAVYLL
ncbi:MAG: M50 family metallopeptidase [Ruminococcus sp.]|nr:M50 family metallopeptidase [Ruminococcus sp.]